MHHHNNDELIVRANVFDPLSIITRSSDFESFVFFSTSSVKLPTQTMYSRTKRATEEVLLAFREKHKLPICIIRPMSITGVGEQKEHLIPTLIRASYSGETVNFVPEPRHDFIDVEDLVNGILNLSNHKVGGVFELGTGTSYSNQEVLEMVEDITGNKIKTNIVNSLRPYDTKKWVSDNFRSRSWGWLPQKTLEVSIKEMVDEYLREKNN